MNQAPPTSTNHATGDASMAGLVTGIIHDAQELLSKQIELVKVEVKEDLRQLATHAAFFAVGSLALLVGFLLLCFMAVHLIHEAWPDLGLGLSFLIVGGVLTLVGGGLVFAAIQRFASFRALPDQSLQGLKENLRWQTNLK
jgi:TRAP-type C4-dicarboxylate transport system permease small subunit